MASSEGIVIMPDMENLPEVPADEEGEPDWFSVLNPPPDSARQLPAHAMEEQDPESPPVRGMDVPGARVQVPVHLGGAVHVERVLDQPDVPDVREALMAYGPAGLYRYDIGLTAESPWGDASVYHVIKVWFQAEPDTTWYHASSRMTGHPWHPGGVATTVRGILKTLERIKAIAEDRDMYVPRTDPQPVNGDLPPWPGDPIRTFRPIKDRPQA